MNTKNVYKILSYIHYNILFKLIVHVNKIFETFSVAKCYLYHASNWLNDKLYFPFIQHNYKQNHTAKLIMNRVCFPLNSSLVFKKTKLIHRNRLLLIQITKMWASQAGNHIIDRCREENKIFNFLFGFYLFLKMEHSHLVSLKLAQVISPMIANLKCSHNVRQYLSLSHQYLWKMWKTVRNFVIVLLKEAVECERGLNEWALGNACLR